MYIHILIAIVNVCSAHWTIDDGLCSLNGEMRNGQCVCYPPWTGSNCGQIKFKPAPNIPAYGWSPNVTSWGGNVVMDNGTYHLYVAEMVNGCGLAYWERNSRIVHATSPSILGPYTFHDQSLGVFAHNPQVMKVNENGQDVFLLFHIGIGEGGSPAHCPPSPPDDNIKYIEKQESRPSAVSGFLHRSVSPNGPWTPVDTHYTSCNNPTAFQHPNGTWFLVCTWFMQRADHYTGPWSDPWPLGPFPQGTGTWEDPFLWVDARGNFHLLSHAYIVPDFRTRTSGHGYSKDGRTWTFSVEEPYNGSVTLQNGDHWVLGSRERPKLLFDQNMKPTHMVTGCNNVCQGHDKSVVGTDWTFTLIQELDS